MEVLKFLVHVGLVGFMVVFVLQLVHCENEDKGLDYDGFVKTDMARFVLNGKSVYFNGFNAYWLMYMAADPSSRSKVTSAFEQASKCKLNLARTWAFSDGGYRALQISPGFYDQEVFTGLDFVISEAKKKGIRLILSLVNNWNDYGGKHQYVQWARERGQSLSNDDDFFQHPVVKQYYKNHIKAVLTRLNYITGEVYKDDPTILAWELINEPHCTNYSENVIQGWVKEMAEYVKSIDSNHLLEIGLEGYYGQEKVQFNPSGYLAGTDFISNNQIPEVDFATMHLYPESWLPNSTAEAQDVFVDKWVETHVNDCNVVLEKPILLSEFGKSSSPPYYSVEKRNSYFKKLYDDIIYSVTRKGAFAGGLFWQLMVEGMDGFHDGLEVILDESPSTATLIMQQSTKLETMSLQ